MINNPRIRAIVEIFSSERDINGNCYHACRWTDTNTGVEVTIGEIGGPRNMDAAMFALGLAYGEFKTTETTLSKKVFKARCGSWQYLHGSPQDVARKLAEAVSAVVCPDKDYPDPDCQRLRYKVQL